MGKWSADYYDDVLHHKLKTLASGAIRRAMLEKSATEPTISYESFVEDLDTGDSFTATVIDILVKEMADRRNRLAATDSDKRLISERTAHSLRSLSAESQIFRRRRRVHPIVSEVAPSPPHHIEDEDDFEELLDANGNMEGVQQNPMFDALGADGGWAEEWTSLVRTSSPDPLDGISGSTDLIPITSPPPQPARFQHHRPLVRQPSIRRTRQPRAVDFNEFSSRRRSANREMSIRDSVIYIRNSPPVDSSAASGSHPQDPLRHNASSSLRRFFPLNRGARRRPSEPVVNMLNDDDSIAGRLYTTITPSSTSPSRESSAEPNVYRTLSPLPRLRRGVGAPEYLSRNASPLIPSLPSPASMVDTSGPSVEREPSV